MSRCSSRNSRIERFVYCTLGPVAIAPGSVFVDPRYQTFCYVTLAVVFSAEARCSDAQIRNRERLRPGPRLTTSPDVHHETRALNDLRIAGWIRSLPLPVPYSSTHVASLLA